MKHEWRKEEKQYYFSSKPTVINVPKMNFITMTGTGNPNEAPFQDRIQTLYPVAYAIRAALKARRYGNPYEYTVYPLEGVWTTLDGSQGPELNKDALTYKIMIRQPDQVTTEIFESAAAEVRSRKDLPLLDQVSFETYEEGPSVQMVHEGPFDTEGETFALLENYLKNNHFLHINTQGQYVHREIYLSDFRRVAPEKQKTLLRYRVEQI